jgi:hypothetical protein
VNYDSYIRTIRADAEVNHSNRDRLQMLLGSVNDELANLSQCHGSNRDNMVTLHAELSRMINMPLKVVPLVHRP